MVGANEVFANCDGWLIVSQSKTTSCKKEISISVGYNWMIFEFSLRCIVYLKCSSKFENPFNFLLHVSHYVRPWVWTRFAFYNSSFWWVIEKRSFGQGYISHYAGDNYSEKKKKDDLTHLFLGNLINNDIYLINLVFFFKLHEKSDNIPSFKTVF